MRKSIRLRPFMQALFPDPSMAQRATEIAHAITEARSLRISDIASNMEGSDHAAYKRVQRFLKVFDPHHTLWKLFPEHAPFVIADITEIPRPQARRTEYVGTLKDGKTRGFWILTLAAPLRGRAIPFAMTTFSSKTLKDTGTSRNSLHIRTLLTFKDLIGNRPIIMDREFSYTTLLRHLKEAGMPFVVRLRMGSQKPVFLDSEGRRVHLVCSPGERVVFRGLWYRGEVEVHVIGVWEKGYGEPLWIMTTLEPEEGLRLYRRRMKIEEAFRDLKSLLGLGRVMSKKREMMEKLVGLLLLVYGILLLLGEELRQELYRRTGSKRLLRFSGPFILLRRKWKLPPKDWKTIEQRVYHAFLQSLYPQPHPHVRTHG